jgi:hypothetical protein
VVPNYCRSTIRRLIDSCQSSDAQHYDVAPRRMENLCNTVFTEKYYVYCIIYEVNFRTHVIFHTFFYIPSKSFSLPMSSCFKLYESCRSSSSSNYFVLLWLLYKTSKTSFLRQEHRLQSSYTATSFYPRCDHSFPA